MAHSLGLSAPTPERRTYGEKRSFFLRGLLTDLIFPEAGLGRFDPRAEERRRWLWRGTLAGAALITIVACTLFLFSFLRYSGGLTDQERQLTKLSSRLSNVAARQAPTDPLDLNLALEAANETLNAETNIAMSAMTFAGPHGCEGARSSPQACL